jgi:hypothetical protein
MLIAEGICPVLAARETDPSYSYLERVSIIVVEFDLILDLTRSRSARMLELTFGLNLVGLKELVTHSI